MTETTTNTNTNTTADTTENQKQTQQTRGNNATELLNNVAGFSTTKKNFECESVLDTAEYRSGFFKQLQGKDLNEIEKAAMKVARTDFERRASEFNTSTDSAALIPTETLNEIISKARTKGGLLAEARAFSVPSGVAIPVATPKDRASWHVEGAEVDSEKISSTSVTFSGYEILKIFSLSLKTQTMTISAFESYLTEELKNCVLETIEYALINGTGAGQGTGIMTVFDSSNTVTASTSIAYSDIIQAVSKLKRGYSNGAKFAMNNRTLWNVFYSMVDGNQRPIFIQDLQNESVGKILGFPVVIDDNLDDNTVLFGNFNYLAYNLASGIAIESSRESSFRKGLIDYRAIAIADTKPLLSEAFVKLTA